MTTLNLEIKSPVSKKIGCPYYRIIVFNEKKKVIIHEWANASPVDIAEAVILALKHFPLTNL